jgi:hypothetical protein
MWIVKEDVKERWSVEEKKRGKQRRLNVPDIIWPDMVFGPVNLWCLPPADFFYRKR